MKIKNKKKKNDIGNRKIIVYFVVFMVFKIFYYD
jgi:hypothetical protein